jgi:hypothetical protein
MSNRPASLVFSLAALATISGGCSSSAQHSLTLIPPISEPCDPAREPGCKPVYDSCDSLNLKTLSIEVGLFARARTELPCPADLGSGAATVSVSYSPGEDFYMIDATYSRNMEKQNLTAGPFLESDREWRIVLK